MYLLPHKINIKRKLELLTKRNGVLLIPSFSEILEACTQAPRALHQNNTRRALSSIFTALITTRSQAKPATLLKPSYAFWCGGETLVPSPLSRLFLCKATWGSRDLLR